MKLKLLTLACVLGLTSLGSAKDKIDPVELLYFYNQVNQNQSSFDMEAYRLRQAMIEAQRIQQQQNAQELQLQLMILKELQRQNR